MSNILFQRNAYVIFGPVTYYTKGSTITPSEQIFISSGLTQDAKSFSVSNTGWPFINIFNPPTETNKSLAGLRTSFEIKKTLSTAENQGTIKIYNINNDTWGLIKGYNETYKVYLVIGYENDTHGIFVGDIEKASRYREGPNWICEIKAKDGQNILQETYINKSYKEDTDIKDILVDLLDKGKNILKEQTKNAISWLKDNLERGKKVQQGLSISGNLLENINKLLKPYDASLSIQDDKIQILYDDSNNKGTCYIISPDSGLINSPVSKNEGIELKCLIIPMLKPGDLIKVESREYNDYFKIENIDIKGDTHTNLWECDIEAVRPTNIFPSVTDTKYWLGK